MAAFIGGHGGKPVPILMAGRDFGKLVDKLNRLRNAAPEDGRAADFVGNLGFKTTAGARDDLAIQQYWPRPF